MTKTVVTFAKDGETRDIDVTGIPVGDQLAHARNVLNSHLGGTSDGWFHVGTRNDALPIERATAKAVKEIR